MAHRSGLRGERTMSYVIEVLRNEHCNIESLLGVLERELSVFDRGDRPNYEPRPRRHRVLQGLSRYLSPP